MPEGAAYLIDDLAAQGYSKAHIARHLGTNERTFREWMERDAKLQQAFDNGRAREQVSLHNALYQRAVDLKNPIGAASAMFLLKARHGYRENDPGDVGNRVNVVFNLPGALTPEQFAIEVDGQPKPISFSTASPQSTGDE